MTAEIETHLFETTKRVLEGDLAKHQQISCKAIKPTDQQRLANTATPISYDLSLKINLPGYGVDFAEEEALKTSGCVEIKIYVPNATNYLELHAKNLDLKRIALRNETIERFLHAEFNTEGKVALGDGEIIENGHYSLLIDFTGCVSNGLGGLYQAHFKGKNGEDRILATTQMCPMDCRTMVPSFDEPAYKATWKLSILHPNQSRSISNGAEEKIIDVPGLSNWKLTIFTETPKMSSYLLALVICDFHSIEARTQRGTLFRVFSQEGTSKQAEYALHAGIKSLECYEKLFGIPFPLGKQDMIAIPDFSFGAMENWGLVTYRETALLLDPEIGTSLEKTRVAGIIAHELAHQWFGNLVTMEFWDDVWLNEGFATFITYFGKEAIDPNFRIWEHFLDFVQSIAFNVDSLASAHPLSFKADSLQKIEESFDILTYRKGASVINMIMNTISKENFFKGLQNYLKKYAYSNAVSNDLWTEFGRYSEIDFGEISFEDFARQWTSQIGFPLLTVEKQSPGKFSISQRRFYLSKTLNPKYPEDSFDTKWHIPVFYKNGNEEKLEILAPNDTLNVETNDGQFPIVNFGAKSFIRVSYGDDGWEEILKRIKNDEFDVITRAKMINDLFACAREGAIKYKTALRFDELISIETEVLPFTQLINGLLDVHKRFTNEPAQALIKKALKHLLNPLLDGISFDEIIRLDRETITSFKAHYFLQLIEAECQVDREGNAGRYLNEFRKNVLQPTESGAMASEGSRVGPLLRQLIYTTAIFVGNDEDFDKTWALYLKETNQAERNKLLSAVCSSKNLEKIRWILRKSVDIQNREIRQQDIKIVFAAFNQNSVTNGKLLELFFEEFDFIYKNLSTSPRELNDVVIGCLDTLTIQQVQMVQKFLEQHPEVKEIGAFEKQLVSAEAELDWKRRFAGEITEFYEKRTTE
ncbi:unnamed protein product, partial [Mesorhabditis belari]|uniref:Aminopeptidase n=1 Tax=Mesorhabditis belari TaxID=2138241 RepID=A0AAF3F2Q9_9BILA